jgi:hypothetical protein
MSDQPKRVFTKDADYAVVYADSVIYQGGAESSRLIFYQREVEPSEPNGERLETKPERITLKFEVRIPVHQLAGLVANINADNEARERQRAETKAAGEDAETIRAWFDLDEKRGDLLLDTLGVEVGDISKSELQAEFEKLRNHRLNRSQ